MTILFAYRHKMDETQVYQFMKSSPLNYITIITNIHMKQNMHINVCILVTITHVKENRKIERKKGWFLCGHDNHVGYIYKFMQ
jgi:hypothetical protein